MDMTLEWEQEASAYPDRWKRRLDEPGWNCGFIHRYEGTNGYCWQAVRHGFRMSGTRQGREAALAAADAALALPIEQFNALAAAEIRIKIADLERDLLKLQPETDVSPGYRIGFAAGQEAMQQKIMAVLS